MTFRLNIKTDNAAFEYDPAAEVASILRKLADNLERFGIEAAGKLRDVNGNTVGEARVSK